MGNSGVSSTLVYHAGALGDFITSLPAIAAWRAMHEGDRAILLGRPTHAGLSEPGFDTVWDAGSAAWAPLFSPGFVPGSAHADRMADVRSAFLFASAGSPLAASLESLGVTEVLRHDPLPQRPLPIVDYHLSLFSPRDAARVGRIPRVRAVTDSVVPPGCIALHPGSGSPGKNWQLAGFFELARCLRAEGHPVSWITGPVEVDVSCPDGAMEWRGLELVDLAGRIGKCAAFVGNDSGVSHLAAASGCPTVTLFGATDPVVWSPRGKRTVTLAAPDKHLDSISPAEVLRTCRMILAG